MSRKVFGYARKNIKSENIDEQVDSIVEYCKNNELDLNERDLVIDKDDANTFNREGYKALTSYMIRSGDILVISELDRLGKEVSAMEEQWRWFNSQDIEIAIVDNAMLSTYGKSDEEKEMVNKIVMELLTYIGEKERQKIKRRQTEGIQALKEKNNGKGIGRPKTKINKEFKEQYKLWKNNKQTAVETFTKLKLTKATFYRLVKEHEESLKSKCIL